jgi:hypothetical protein
MTDSKFSEEFDRMLDSLFPWDEFPDMKLSNDSAGELALLVEPKWLSGVICKESLFLSEPRLLQPPRPTEVLH